MDTPEELQQRLDRAHAALEEQQRLDRQLKKIVDLKHALLEEEMHHHSYTKSLMIQVCDRKNGDSKGTPMQRI